MTVDSADHELKLPTHYWWVNHKETFRQELDGSYLWSPKKNKNGGRNLSYDNMTRTVPGDVVFSFAEGKVGAVGVVIDRVRTAPTPARSGPAAQQSQTDPGWLLPVRFEALSKPLAPKDHLAKLAPLLPAKHSPIRVTGDGKQGVYLAEIPADMAAALRELLGGQLQRIEEEVAIETGDQLTDSAIEEHIWQRENLDAREKRQLTSARIGQGIFRENVERVEQGCRVTGVLDRRHLRASHIKPWRLCDDREKLDGFNGLLLSPHIDHLFGRGHVSFADDGHLLISKHLNPSVVKAWGLDKTHPSQPFRPQQRRYLHFHRQYVFEKVTGGRRG
jgi:putative restriction endonuclease